MHNGKFQKNSEKIKNIKKNTIMASFQSKIGWKRLRKRENKNYRSVSFQLDVLENNSKTNSKKIKNIKKYHYGILSSKK